MIFRRKMMEDIKMNVADGGKIAWSTRTKRHLKHLVLANPVLSHFSYHQLVKGPEPFPSVLAPLQSTKSRRSKRRRGYSPQLPDATGVNHRVDELESTGMFCSIFSQENGWNPKKSWRVGGLASERGRKKLSDHHESQVIWWHDMTWHSTAEAHCEPSALIHSPGKRVSMKTSSNPHWLEATSKPCCFKKTPGIGWAPI